MAEDMQYGEGTVIAFKEVDDNGNTIDGSWVPITRCEDIELGDREREEIEFTTLTSTARRKKPSKIVDNKEVKFNHFWKSDDAVESQRLQQILGDNHKVYLRITDDEGEIEYCAGYIKSIGTKGYKQKEAVKVPVTILVDGDWTDTDPS